MLARAGSALALLGLGALVACEGTREAVAPTPPPLAAPAPRAQPSVEEARAFFGEVDESLRRVLVAQQRAAWENDGEVAPPAADEARMEDLTRTIKASARFNGVVLPPDLARQRTLLRLSADLPAPSDAKKRSELAATSAWMSRAYREGKYCPPRLAAKAECQSLGDLESILAQSRKWDELEEAWVGWHAIARPIRPKFARYVELVDEGARELGFPDNGALWRAGYDMPPDAFEADTERLWQEVKPVYEQLHCYVRAKLRARYGKDKIPAHAPIPAHLLGNMWAQEWGNVYDVTEPYKGHGSLDVTKHLKEKKIDERTMVKLGERAFVSLGMDPLPETFWERSLFKRPADRQVSCRASAWDVGYSNDLRIKMCIEPKEEDLVTIHHELGHDYYFHAYYKLPMLFQSGANDAFHEGIGETLALAVTPAYLKRLGLLEKVPKDEKRDLNALFKMALDKIAFLPFGKLIDQWRWDVFSGKTARGDYNKAWWALRLEYQGIAAPVARTEDDFDPGAKYHVPANLSYVRYFLARIYQFQFYRALCRASGHEGPLHTCSFYGSRAAGERLSAMLAIGASRPWPEAMQAISGEDHADAGAMLEYFAPLTAWLKERNKGESCGW